MNRNDVWNYIHEFGDKASRDASIDLQETLDVMSWLAKECDAANDVITRINHLIYKHHLRNLDTNPQKRMD